MINFDLLHSKINVIMVIQVLDKVSQGLTVVCSHANNPRTVYIFVH
jgi:hypothetical protein